MSIDVEIDGRQYRWSGSSWYDTETHRTPSPRERQWLERKLQQRGATLGVDDPVARLLARAQQVSAQGNHDYALELVNQALEVQPDHPEALALLCSTLAALGSPTQGLLQTDAWRDTCCGELLLARAGALCELQLWEEAKVLALRAVAMGAVDGPEGVLARVRAAQPELFSEEG